MRNYNNFRATVLNKMASLFPCDGTQYQWTLWEDCSTLVPVEGYDFYEISYRIYGFGRCGVRFRLDESQNVTQFWFFSTLPGMGNDTREFKAWVENDLGNEPETDHLQTLREFVKSGGNAAKLLEKYCHVTRSSYHEHYQDGDTDETVEGFDCHAKLCDIANVNGIDYVCVRSYKSSSEDYGWSGCTNSTYWVRLFSLIQHSDKLLLNEATLMQSAVSITGADIETLLKLPINWTELVGYHSGTSYSYSYMHGSRCEIYVCELYVTVHIIETRNSSSRQCGWEYISKRFQFLLNGTDNTAAYVAYCKRKHYAEKLSTLLAEGISLADAKRWLKARAEWKHENKPTFCLEMAKLADKNFWMKLAGSRGWNHAAKLIEKAGLTDKLSWFSKTSFPRATDTCALIAQLSSETMSGIGWTLTTES